MKEPKVINGKTYHLWQQFLDKEQEYIGGTLHDMDDGNQETTEITAIRLEPNGKESAAFYVDGKEYGCGFDVSVGGVTGGEHGWVTFCGYGGHIWRIKRKEVTA